MSIKNIFEFNRLKNVEIKNIAGFFGGGGQESPQDREHPDIN